MDIKKLENINIKLLSKNAKVPTKGSEYAAGYDLYANTTGIIVIAPHSTIKVGTGISIELSENTFGAIFARSGLATRRGLRPANCVGVIDADYRGEIIIALHNDTNEIMSIEPNERIAQLVVMPFIPVNFTVVEELNETKRGDGGFGSTGTN
jgi:dUTP pyrophosphatase